MAQAKLDVDPTLRLVDQRNGMRGDFVLVSGYTVLAAVLPAHVRVGPRTSWRCCRAEQKL